MRLNLKRRRIAFFQGMLSAFGLHPDGTFRYWMKENSSRSDLDNLRRDLAQVGADMRKATTNQINRSTAQ
jgi:hypothetical protein